jgi:hypothetical protein
MDVSERKDKLQRHRCEREPSAPPPISSNPTHHGSLPSRAICSACDHSYRRWTMRSTR